VVTNKTVIVEGSGATLTESGNTSTFTVNDNATVRIHGLTIVNDVSVSGRQIGVQCLDPSAMARPILTLIGVTVDSTGEPILADNCELNISQSLIHSRSNSTGTFLVFVSNSDVVANRTVFDGGDAIESDGGIMRITNSVISNQTGVDGAFVGGGGGAVDVSFSTIVNSEVRCNVSGLAVCTGTSANGVCVDNSIIVYTNGNPPSDMVTGAACTFRSTLVFPQSAVLPGLADPSNKIGVDPQLTDPANGNFHLRSTSPAIDAADPLATNMIDFDGTMRPIGLHADTGAFEFHP